MCKQVVQGIYIATNVFKNILFKFKKRPNISGIGLYYFIYLLFYFILFYSSFFTEKKNSPCLGIKCYTVNKANNI